MNYSADNNVLTLGESIIPQDNNLLSVNFLGMDLSSPLMVGSGPLTDSLQRIKKYFILGAGAVISKTIFSGQHPEVEEKIHVSETGLFNSTTYSTKTLPEWTAIINELSNSNFYIIPSIHAETPELLGELAVAMTHTSCKSIELGIACPNDGSQQRIDAKLIADYTLQVRKRTSLPLIVKLAAADNYLEQMSAAIEAGANAISISDTLPSVVFNSDKRQYEFDGPIGYSGAAIKPIVLHSIYQARKNGINCPIIGIGGIQSAQDVLEYLHVGANVVQIYTALMLNSKKLVSTINNDLIKWCIKNNTPINKILRN